MSTVFLEQEKWMLPHKVRVVNLLALVKHDCGKITK
jgi:hypothetical protein